MCTIFSCAVPQVYTICCSHVWLTVGVTLRKKLKKNLIPKRSLKFDSLTAVPFSSTVGCAFKQTYFSVPVPFITSAVKFLTKDKV